LSKISETFNVGDRENISPERLLLLLETMYFDLASAINRKPDVYERDTDGLTTDIALSNGDININTTTENVEMLTSHTDPTTVIWTAI
jgi:hypothetical protein